MKKIYLVLSVIVFCTMLSCKKDNNPTVIQVSQVDSGKVVSLIPGQQIDLTVNDPADSGYTFNAPQYNPQVLKLLNHYHENPAAGSLPGNYGADLWQFSAINEGATPLSITAKLSDTTTVTIFSGEIDSK